MRTTADQKRLRRLALDSQGLLQVKPFGRGMAGARKAIAHLGYVQIDTISVVERAHHHVIQTRVPGFDPSMTNRLLRSRDIFEYWSHAAAFLPMSDFRYSLPYKNALKNGQIHWYRTRDRKLMQELLTRIRLDGPLRSRDLEKGTGRRAGWWDWKPAKQALEQLYMEGDLMVSDRDGFQKTYDLTERVLPPDTDLHAPTTHEFAEHLLDQQLRCHGLVSPKSVTYLRRNGDLRDAVRELIRERQSQGLLQPLRLASGEVFFVGLDAYMRRLPRVEKRVRILSPFDNAVIQRERLAALFDYDYQIECYVPEAKRRFGYFSLPLLYGDAFVGRMDCKAHRNEKRFEIKSLFLDEPTMREEQFVVAFADAVSQFIGFQGCESVTLTKVSPRNMTRVLRNALAARQSYSGSQS